MSTPLAVQEVVGRVATTRDLYARQLENARLAAVDAQIRDAVAYYADSLSRRALYLGRNTAQQNADRIRLLHRVAQACEQVPS